MPEVFDYHRAFSRNIGWVTPAEQSRLSECRVAIAGLGGVGGEHLLTLCRMGFGKFHIADFDTFGLENFNRQIGAKISTLGKSKVDCMVEAALDINPQLDITTFPVGVTEDNLNDFLKDVEVYIDGLDFFALSIRRQVFARCRELGIPAITCAPLGTGVCNLNFLPGKMGFEDYFLLEGQSDAEQYLRFFVGLSPARLHAAYLVVPEAVNLAEQRGPSTVMACQLCAGVAATQALKLVLRRGTVLAAPHCLQFDPYRNQTRVSWRPWGNANPINRLALAIGRKVFLSKPPPLLHGPSSSTEPLRHVMDRARWAPSGDNTQCWRFELTGPLEMKVLANDTRRDVVYDKNGAASNLAHGALLETLHLAAAQIGYRAVFSPPDRSDPERPVYGVRLQKDDAIQPDPLAAFIETRRVQRRPMKTQRLDAATRKTLEMALPAGYQVFWIESAADRWRVARLMFSNAYTRLIMKEGYEVHRKVIDWGKSFSEDKIPEKALGVDPVSARMMKWALASWARFEFLAKYLGGTIAPRIQLDLVPAWRCGAHFVIHAAEPALGLNQQVAAGRALQRFWLCATQQGLGLQPEQTLVIFSDFVRDGAVFSSNPVALRNAAAVDQRLKALLPRAVFENKVFFGSIGHSTPPTARSLRLPLEHLMVTG